MIAATEMGDYEKAFLQAYKREFGFVLTGRAIIADDIRSAPVAVPIMCRVHLCNVSFAAAKPRHALECT